MTMTTTTRRVGGLTVAHRMQCDQSHTGFVARCNTRRTRTCQWCSRPATTTVVSKALCKADAATAKVQLMLGMVSA